jgi:hypothetical protein
LAAKVKPMRGEELWEFIIEIESRFPDLYLTPENRSLINAVEREHIGREIGFYEVVAILKTIVGYSASSSDETQSGNFQENKETIYRQRIAELETDLIALREKEEKAQDELSHVYLELSRANQRINEVQFAAVFSIFSCSETVQQVYWRGRWQENPGAIQETVKCGVNFDHLSFRTWKR